MRICHQSFFSFSTNFSTGKAFFQHQEQHDFQMKGFKDGPYQLSGKDSETLEMHSEPASLQPHSH